MRFQPQQPEKECFFFSEKRRERTRKRVLSESEKVHFPLTSRIELILFLRNTKTHTPHRFVVVAVSRDGRVRDSENISMSATTSELMTMIFSQDETVVSYSCRNNTYISQSDHSFPKRLNLYTTRTHTITRQHE